MLMDVVKIGNSKGIRIPANILKDLKVKDKVEFIVEDNCIILKPINEVRSGWDKAFNEMHKNNDDSLIIDENLDCEGWEW